MEKEQDGATFYPTIPVSRWWELRKKWRQSLPSLVSPRSLAISLEMEERSARLNIFNGLIKLGLIDKDGKTTDKANNWRENDLYPEVCNQMRQDVYPKELLELAPGPEINRNEVERWFRLNGNVGDNQARKMASVYMLLTEADPTKGQEPAKPVKSGAAKSAVKQQANKGKVGKSDRQPVTTDGTPAVDTPLTNPPVSKGNPTPQSFSPEPSIHLDIQIHISPDASAEQIDQVFASMAKHLYPSRKSNDGQ